MRERPPLRCPGWQLAGWQLLTLALACGGSTDLERPEPGQQAPGIPGYLSAPQGAYPGFVDCRARQDIELVPIQDFEFGAAGGWYTGNDVCAECQDPMNAADALRPTVYPLVTELQQLEALGDLAGEGQQRRKAELEAMLSDLRPELEALEAQIDACLPGCNQAQPSPAWTDNPPAAQLIPEGGRCGSRYAMHLKGGPFLDWGGNMGFGFSPPRNVTDQTVKDPLTGETRVGEDLDGITFWARTGETPSNANLAIQLGERHTSQDFTGGPDGGPICNPNITDDNSEEGCDQFGATAQLRSTWQQFVVPFAEMRQAGWGRRAEFFDLQGLMSLTIFYSQGSWDFWIDDLAFYRRKR